MVEHINKPHVSARHDSAEVFQGLAGMKLAVTSRAPELRDAVAHMDREALRMLLAEIRDRVAIEDNACEWVPRNSTVINSKFTGKTCHTRNLSTSKNRSRTKKS